MPGSNAHEGALAAAIRQLLRPLVRLLLRNGVSVKAFGELVKQAYVEGASEELREGDRAPTASRIAVLTGLTRKDVSRLTQPAGAGDEAPGHYNRAARVLTAWVRERRFHDSRGRPASLPFEAARGPSFSDLVRRHSGDMTPRAVLDELVRVGAVSQTRGGRVRLLRHGYVPRSSETEKLAILGADVAELIGTIDHNITSPPEGARFQRKVAYDNLPSEALPRLRARAAENGQALLEELDRAMARADRDANPKAAAGSGRHRAVVGIYFFEDEVLDDEGSDDPDEA